MIHFFRNMAGALLLHYSRKQSMSKRLQKKGRLYYSNYRSINYSSFVLVLIEYHEGLVWWPLLVVTGSVPCCRTSGAPSKGFMQCRRCFADADLVVHWLFAAHRRFHQSLILCTFGVRGTQSWVRAAIVFHTSEFEHLAMMWVVIWMRFDSLSSLPLSQVFNLSLYQTECVSLNV